MLSYNRVIQFIAWKLCFLSFALMAETNRTPPNVGVDEKLGQKIPLDLNFQNEAGETVPLQKYFESKQPVIIVPSYYVCKHLCRFVFQGVRQAADNAYASGIRLGKDYRIVSVSLDEYTTPKIARKKAEQVREAFQQTSVRPQDWNFLTGKKENISQLMRSLGYRYHRDPQHGHAKGKNASPHSDDISHSAAIVLISPQGKITRYLYGVTFPNRDFRLALVEAANGKVGDTIDRILLYCFRYDSVEKKYTPFAWAFMRIGGGLTVIFLLGLWYILRRRKIKFEMT